MRSRIESTDRGINLVRSARFYAAKAVDRTQVDAAFTARVVTFVATLCLAGEALF